jgi:hypothetical protein
MKTVDKIAVIKCLGGFTVKSTELAYRQIYLMFVKNDANEENDSP